MKKTVKQIVCAATVLTVLAFLCVFASAANIESIKVGNTENGTVEVSVDPSDETKALVTVKPDKGYLAADVNLKTNNGASLAVTRTDTANVYSCDIPAEEATLTVQFRTARVVLNKTELAMNSGEAFTVTATLTCTDGEINTRDKILDREIVFASSNPEVASIDPKTGVLTAHKMGYARITASAAAGNGIEGFFYVIVDGDKSPVVGTIQLNAYFDEELLISDLIPGHSFLIFTNTSGENITVDTKELDVCQVPTEEYYETVNSYDGEGYDPVTYLYVTNGEQASEENKEARKAYMEKLFTEYKRGELRSYTIKPNDIISIGNTGAAMGWENGNIEEVLARYGKSFELEKIKKELLTGTIDAEAYLYRIAELVNEICYDSVTGYNPFNGTYGEGVCLNGERTSQLNKRSYADAAGCRTKITAVQLEAMMDFVQYDNYFSMLERNCTALASSAWNLVTAAKPQYHMVPHRGGITTVFATPLWLRNSILAKAVALSADPEIEFFNGIGVIKPIKNLGADCEHNFVDGKCTECGAIDTGFTPTFTVKDIIARVLMNIREMLSRMFGWLPIGKN